MIYLLYWFICATASFMLLKTYITSNLSRLPSPPENIAQAMRNAAKRDKEVDPMHDCPDHIANALFWTIILVYNLVCWPWCLMTLIWWNINKQDFSDFRG